MFRTEIACPPEIHEFTKMNLSRFSPSWRAPAIGLSSDILKE
jgi:hypothetical protein